MTIATGTASPATPIPLASSSSTSLPPSSSPPSLIPFLILPTSYPSPSLTTSSADPFLHIPSPMSHLQLQGNNFSDTIPYGLIGSSSCTTNLTSIDLSNNQFSGALTVDIDVSSSAKCQSLVHLKLFNNQLQDGIPPEIGNCSNLKTLLMDGNIFQGNIPPEIGRLPHIIVLDVSQNSLIGNIPPKLASCTKLSTLILTNLLEIEGDDEFNAFAFPLFPLPCMMYLNVSYNSLTGPAPNHQPH